MKASSSGRASGVGNNLLMEKAMRHGGTSRGNPWWWTEKKANRASPDDLDCQEHPEWNICRIHPFCSSSNCVISTINDAAFSVYPSTSTPNPALHRPFKTSIKRLIGDTHIVSSRIFNPWVGLGRGGDHAGSLIILRPSCSGAWILTNSVSAKVISAALNWSHSSLLRWRDNRIRSRTNLARSLVKAEGIWKWSLYNSRVAAMVVRSGAVSGRMKPTVVKLDWMVDSRCCGRRARGMEPMDWFSKRRYSWMMLVELILSSFSLLRFDFSFLRWVLRGKKGRLWWWDGLTVLLICERNFRNFLNFFWGM